MEIKMGVNADNRSPVNVKQPQGALSWKLAPKGAAWHLRRFAQEEVYVLLALDCLSIKKDIVLPEPWGRMVPTDVLISGQTPDEIVDLEIVGFLCSDKIRCMFSEKPSDGFFSIFPPVAAILGKAKTKIKRHDRKCFHLGSRCLFRVKQMEICLHLDQSSSEAVKGHIAEGKIFLLAEDFENGKIVEQNPFLPFQVKSLRQIRDVRF